jgi:hypothetical protein
MATGEGLQSGQSHWDCSGLAARTGQSHGKGMREATAPTLPPFFICSEIDRCTQQHNVMQTNWWPPLVSLGSPTQSAPHGSVISSTCPGAQSAIVYWAAMLSNWLLGCSGGRIGSDVAVRAVHSFA